MAKHTPRERARSGAGVDTAGSPGEAPAWNPGPPGSVTGAMSTHSFAVNWDYRCPFARNAHEHVVKAIEGGAGWDVSFVPFSLSQVHVPEGEPPVWDRPDKRPDLMAMQVGIVVRDRMPEVFGRVHLALFSARHDEARDLREEAELRKILADGGVDADSVFAEIDAGWPLHELRDAHERSVSEHKVFGVPTFIIGDRAVFVRLMTRPDEDASRSQTTIEGVLELITDRPELNEFKYTTINR